MLEALSCGTMPLPIGNHGGDAPYLVTIPLFELKLAQNSSRPTIVIARVSNNHYCAVAPRLPCCAGELCKMKNTLKQEAWLILCDGCNEPFMLSVVQSALRLALHPFNLE